MTTKMKLKAKVSEVDTSSTFSLGYRSEPYIPSSVSNADQAGLKLKLKYRE
jgi:hypothetical protein